MIRFCEGKFFKGKNSIIMVRRRQKLYGQLIGFKRKKLKKKKSRKACSIRTQYFYIYYINTYYLYLLHKYKNN